MDRHVLGSAINWLNTRQEENGKCLLREKIQEYYITHFKSTYSADGSTECKWNEQFQKVVKMERTLTNENVWCLCHSHEAAGVT